MRGVAAAPPVYVSAVKRYSMAPGPTPVLPEALAAGAEPVIHRGLDFRALMLRCLGRLQEVLRHAERRAALHAASGSGASSPRS